MEAGSFLLFRILSAAVFFAALAAGGYFFKNFDRLFGKDPNLPSENSSARAYSKVQALVVWAHVLLASAAFALLLH